MNYVALIADDSTTIRKFVSFALEMSGMRVVKSVDGLDALEKLANNKVEIAIVDLNMPNMDGFELIESLRASEEYSNLPVIVLSSERSTATKKRAEEAGANLYLEKPFDSNALISSIKQLLS